MTFPIVRMRRLRQSQALRDMVAETNLGLNDLIYPMFTCPGKNVCQGVPSMPGINRYSIDSLAEECKKVADLGIPAVMLFGIPEHKDPLGRGAYDQNGIIPRAVRAVKKAVPGLLVMCDVCLCEYTDHGHCGILDGEKVHNDATLELLAKAAVAYAKAGCDMVAPSDMMDGRVMEIREALDEEGFDNTPIMAYAAKYCSAFYGPFRDAANSAPSSATAGAIRWTPETPWRPCARCSSILKKARTSSWSSRPCPIWTSWPGSARR